MKRIFDEAREAWRADFLARARTLVAGCTSATEAAQALNRDLFNHLNVHYHTGRRAPNQGASESLALGKASCSGLSILLVYACRAVGIPARAVPVEAETWQKGFMPYGTPCSQMFDPATQKLEILRCEIETLRKQLDALTAEREEHRDSA